MQFIHQEDRDGCGPACLAMITGKTYAWAVQRFPDKNFKKHGLSRRALEDELQTLGYGLCRRKDTRRPFGDVMLVEVQTHEQVEKGRDEWHWVVAFDDGTVMDPSDPDEAHHKLEDYAFIRMMTVVQKIAEEDAWRSSLGTSSSPSTATASRRSRIR